ncbi:MAG TPA: hypothetical protein VMS17_05985 [Gemmataceae bacterium]|nr:hypothetical protein [Gemmataceae bacterium]
MSERLTRRAALGAIGTTGLAALAATAFLPSKAAAGEHPHLHRVLEELRAAKDELENTEHRFGGHKREAIEAIRVAIDQVKICIDNE